MSQPLKRIAVTGMGVVSPLGNDIPTFWNALCSGKDGISQITSCDLSDFVIQQGGQVTNVELPPELHAEFGDDRRLRIPMRPGNRSLNLSNAAAVVVYEAWRQASFAGGS